MEEVTLVSISDQSLNITLISASDQSLSIIKWDPLTSPLLIVFLLAFLIGGVSCRTLIVNYVLRYAPKKRPMNSLILIDQVQLCPIHLRHFSVGKVGTNLVARVCLLLVVYKVWTWIGSKFEVKLANFTLFLAIFTRISKFRLDEGQQNYDNA